MPRRIGRTKGGLNSKLHVVCDGDGKLLVMPLSEGQMSDHPVAKLLYPNIPSADTLIADKSYDSDEFRHAPAARNVEACIPPKRNRKTQHSYDKQLYKTRHKIENVFGKSRYGRYASRRLCENSAFRLVSQTRIAWFEGTTSIMGLGKTAPATSRIN